MGDFVYRGRRPRRDLLPMSVPWRPRPASPRACSSSAALARRPPSAAVPLRGAGRDRSAGAIRRDGAAAGGLRPRRRARPARPAPRRRSAASASLRPAARRDRRCNERAGARGEALSLAGSGRLGRPSGPRRSTSSSTATGSPCGVAAARRRREPSQRIGRLAARLGASSAPARPCRAPSLHWSGPVEFSAAYRSRPATTCAVAGAPAAVR